MYILWPKRSSESGRDCLHGRWLRFSADHPGRCVAASRPLCDVAKPSADMAEIDKVQSPISYIPSFHHDSISSYITRLPSSRISISRTGFPLNRASD